MNLSRTALEESIRTARELADRSLQAVRVGWIQAVRRSRAHVFAVIGAGNRRRLRHAWAAAPTHQLRRAAPYAAGVLVILAGSAAVTGVGIASTHGHLLAHLPVAPETCPTRLYAQPARLAQGLPADPDALVAHLSSLGYRIAERRLEPGTFWQAEDRVSIALRRYPLPVGSSAVRGGVRLDLVIEDGRIDTLMIDGGSTTAPVDLEPLELAAVFDDSLVDCRPVLAEELPEHVVRAVLAAEDHAFFDHGGVSPAGILRAAWVNVAAGDVRQGGSTITQQLVKNLYLTPERSLARKAREAVLAIGVESRYEKDAILTSYLNHAYWGRLGAAQLVGIEAAARGWFSKSASELSAPEAALLAGMIRSPGRYDPVAQPERARSRRNWVLQRMHELGWLDGDAYRAAIDRPLAIRPGEPTGRRAPYFVEWAAAEARHRFGLKTSGGGYRILTTLSPSLQDAAERSVTERLAELDDEGELQAALVSLEPRTGAVRAWVGGRDWSRSVFDRVVQSRRQVGSVFKPFVHAAAIETGTALPGDSVYDAPLLVAYGDEYWLPRNNDGEFRGPLSLQRTLELSLNVPTVRVALATGVHEVRDLGARFALVERNAEAIPSLALGTAEASPLAVARAYAAFAADGQMPTPYAIEAVYGPHGAESGAPLPPPLTVVSSRTSHLITGMLQSVVDRGTARRVRSLGLRDAVAGKTGTSNDQRDAWFAGYAPSLATVVWVGRDDDRSTGYYGSQAALPIWADTMAAARPDDGYGNWSDRDDIEKHRIDPASGELATEFCPEAVEVSYPSERVPTQLCRLHGREFRAVDRTDRGVADSILRPRRIDWTPARVLWGMAPESQRNEAFWISSAMAPLQLDAPDPYAVVPTDMTPWERFQRRLSAWEDTAASTGAVRVFEVPADFALPCVTDGRSTIDSDACTPAPGGRVGG